MRYLTAPVLHQMSAHNSDAKRPRWGSEAPWLRHVWTLSVLLGVLLPFALAWFLREPPAYALADLGPLNTEADGATSFLMPRPGPPSSVSTRPKHPTPPRLFQRYINAGGQAAWSEYREEERNAYIRSFLIRQGHTLDLGTLGGRSCEVRALSASGHIVGWSHTRKGEPHAFLWKDGVMRDLGTLPGGHHSEAYALNARDQIVGYSHTATGDFHAVLWDNGNITDLGTLPGGEESFACALNEKGQVVGWASPSNGGSHAVIWRQGHLEDLNRLVPYQAERVLERATAINDRGQIWARGTVQGCHHAYLLTPR